MKVGIYVLNTWKWDLCAKHTKVRKTTSYLTFSCSARNLASAKVCFAAVLIIIKLRNQYLNKEGNIIADFVHNSGIYYFIIECNWLWVPRELSIHYLRRFFRQGCYDNT